MVSEIFNKLYIRTVIAGNIDKQTALSCSLEFKKAMLEKFNSGILSESEVFFNQTRKLQSGEHVRYELVNTDKKEKNSVMMLNYQFGEFKQNSILRSGRNDSVSEVENEGSNGKNEEEASESSENKAPYLRAVIDWLVAFIKPKYFAELRTK